jgi:hypothetical protein
MIGPLAVRCCEANTTASACTRFALRVARKKQFEAGMRAVQLSALILLASASACGGEQTRKPASATEVRRTTTTRTVTPTPYAQQYDPSGWSGSSERPTAIGGGPPPQSSEELRSTPRAPRYTSPAPTGLSPTKIERDGTTNPSPATPAEQPGKKPLPPDLGPPPPSADVEPSPQWHLVR